ncbi:MAG TPA: MmgE/PrpD family protein [Dehalococcoidia bacterium]|nr:MmgE/PrpD family protein [Dehalococcoidia bacterium]
MDQTTELLSSYACHLSYEDLSPPTVHQIKRTVVDTLGCAMGGYLSEPGKVARRLASSISSTMPSRILGTEDHSSMDMAGFANGVMVRYLDCNDSYFSPGGGHPSDMIPAALAAGDTLRADGQTVITAIALAYEIFCRISDQVPESGWDQGIFSVIGAACAAGRVMGLDQERMAHAISLAVVPNIPLRVTRMGELSMWKGCAAASATRAGIFAAQLAAEGMCGPLEPFEGRKGLWESALGRPQIELEAFGGANEPFRINQSTFKFYPSQIHTQSPIGLAIELHSQVNPSDIKSIHIDSYRSAVSSASTEPEKWDPRTRETADHSIPFLVAVGLLDGAVTPATFTAERIGDPALRPLLNKMTIEENAEFTARYPSEYNCRIEVTTNSGDQKVAATSYPKGHRNNPLSDTEVSAKFRRLATPTLTSQQCDEALDLLWSLDNLTSLDDVFDALVV